MKNTTVYSVRQIAERYQVMANTTPLGYIFTKREDAEAKAAFLSARADQSGTKGTPRKQG